MKVTRLQTWTDARTSLSGLSTGSSGGGGGGQAPVSDGSNGVAWQSIVQGIFADGSPVNGPFVNIAAGSNIVLTRDAGPLNSVPSNTIRIHATGGGSVSYGSNANAVSQANAPGAATEVSRADHVHMGVQSIAHASNTFTGPVIFTTSGTAGITVPTPGTYNFSASGGTSGGGGSGMTQSYLGYNTIGGTWTATVSGRMYTKKITMSTAGFVMSIDIYVRPSTDNFSNINGLILSDSSGPTLLIAGNDVGSVLMSANAPETVKTPRWFSIPLATYLTAGDYWIGFRTGSTLLDIANDGSGSDVTWTNVGGNFISGKHASLAQTTGTVQYSIRASILA